MACIYRARLNALWSIWYCVLVVLLHAYLVYLGIERYKLYADLPWPADDERQQKIWLTVYGVLHAVSVCLIPVFIATAAFKTGNLPSDNDRLGSRPERTVRSEGGRIDCCSHNCKSLWQHAPPVAQTVHALMAFCLLMAQQLMLGMLYRAQFIKDDSLWSTELDVILRRAHLLARNLPLDLTSDFRVPTAAFDNRAIGVRLVPLLVNQHLFGVPLEFVHYVLALLAITIVYPSVFWRASKWFSLVFSLHLFVHAIEAIFGYIGFSLLYRIQLTDRRAGSAFDSGVIGLNTPAGGKLPFLLFMPYILVGVYVGAATLVYLAGICVYGYGYNKFYTCWAARRSRLVQMGSAGKGGVENSMTRSMIHGNAASALCCEGYGPHIAAIGMLVLMVLVKAPLMYDLMVLYQQQSPVILFACIVADVVYLFWWIILWLALTLKRDWSFRVLHNVPELITMLQADRQPGLRPKDQERRRTSELMNALLMVHGDDAFYTTDDTVKVNIMRQAQKYGVCPTRDDAYWLRSSSGHTSPTTRRTATMDKGSPEGSRLLPDAVVVDQDGNTLTRLPPGYQTLDRRNHLTQDEAYGSAQLINHQPPQREQHYTQHQKQPSIASSYTTDYGQQQQRGGHQQPVSTFGTLPRTEMRGVPQRAALATNDVQVEYVSRQQMQDQLVDQQTYIHAQKYGTGSSAQYMDAYGTLGSNYARPAPPQARILAMTDGGSSHYGSHGGTNNYAYVPNSLNSGVVRQSPTRPLRQQVMPSTSAANGHSNGDNAVYASRQQQATAAGTSTFLPAGSQASSIRSPSSDQGVASGSGSSREETPIVAQNHQQQSRHDSETTLTATTTANVYWTHGGQGGVYQVTGNDKSTLNKTDFQVALMEDSLGLQTAGPQPSTDKQRPPPQHWAQAAAAATMELPEAQADLASQATSEEEERSTVGPHDRTPPGTLTSQGSYTLAVTPGQSVLVNDHFGTINGNRARATLTVSGSYENGDGLQSTDVTEARHDSANFSLASSESGLTAAGQHRNASTGAQFATSCV